MRRSLRRTSHSSFTSRCRISKVASAGFARPSNRSSRPRPSGSDPANSCHSGRPAVPRWWRPASITTWLRPSRVPATSRTSRARAIPRMTSRLISRSSIRSFGTVIGSRTADRSGDPASASEVQRTESSTSDQQRAAAYSATIIATGWDPFRSEDLNLSWGASTPPCGVKHLLDSMWLSAPQPRGKRHASVHPIVSLLTSGDLLRYLNSWPGSSGGGSRPGRTGRVRCRTVEPDPLGAERPVVGAGDLGRRKGPGGRGEGPGPPGAHGLYDVKSDAVIRSIHVAGTLTFAPRPRHAARRRPDQDPGRRRRQRGRLRLRRPPAGEPDGRRAPTGAGGRHARPARSTPGTRP